MHKLHAAECDHDGDVHQFRSRWFACKYHGWNGADDDDEHDGADRGDTSPSVQSSCTTHSCCGRAHRLAVDNDDSGGAGYGCGAGDHHGCNRRSSGHHHYQRPIHSSGAVGTFDGCDGASPVELRH